MGLEPISPEFRTNLANCHWHNAKQNWPEYRCLCRYVWTRLQDSCYEYLRFGFYSLRSSPKISSSRTSFARLCIIFGGWKETEERKGDCNEHYSPTKSDRCSLRVVTIGARFNTKMLWKLLNLSFVATAWDGHLVLVATFLISFLTRPKSHVSNVILTLKKIHASIYYHVYTVCVYICIVAVAI